jgi:hypothetical protein
MTTRIPVKSSAILSVGHDPANNTLEVEYSSGKVYKYHGISEKDYEKALDCQSLGLGIRRLVSGEGITFEQMEKDIIEQI